MFIGRMIYPDVLIDVDYDVRYQYMQLAVSSRLTHRYKINFFPLSMTPRL